MRRAALRSDTSRIARRRKSVASGQASEAITDRTAPSHRRTGLLTAPWPRTGRRLRRRQIDDPSRRGGGAIEPGGAPPAPGPWFEGRLVGWLCPLVTSSPLRSAPELTMHG